MCKDAYNVPATRTHAGGRAHAPATHSIQWALGLCGAEQHELLGEGRQSLGFYVVDVE